MITCRQISELAIELAVHYETKCSRIVDFKRSTLTKLASPSITNNDDFIETHCKPLLQLISSKNISKVVLKVRRIFRAIDGRGRSRYLSSQKNYLGVVTLIFNVQNPTLEIRDWSLFLHLDNTVCSRSFPDGREKFFPQLT